MLFEDKSAKCPNCQSPLTLLSHGIRFEKTEVHEFDFQCDKCNRKYEFKDGVLAAKPSERDQIGESEAIKYVNYRMPSVTVAIVAEAQS